MFPVQLSFASRIIAIIYYAKYDYPVQIKTVNKSINFAVQSLLLFPVMLLIFRRQHITNPMRLFHAIPCGVAPSVVAVIAQRRPLRTIT
jgi:hypothetical protein